MVDRNKRNLNNLTISFDIKGAVAINKSNDMYVAEFPSLNIASQGHTKEEAKMMLADAIISVITAGIERGTLIEYLKEHNYKVKIKFAKQHSSTLDEDLKKVYLKKDDYIKVPIFLKAGIDKNTRLQMT